MIDTYAIYCQWCKDHHQTPPTREWWDQSIAKALHAPTDRVIDFQSEFEFDVATERREGWGYDR